VREPEREHVLDRLLAEVVVDSEYLVLGKLLADQLVQVLRRSEVVAERLLDDQPDPAVTLAPRRDLANERLDRARRHGEVIDAVSLRTALRVDLAEQLGQLVLARGVREIERAVAHAVCELVPDLLTELVSRVLAHRLL